MTRRIALPLVAGLIAAIAAFGLVALADGDGDERAGDRSASAGRATRAAPASPSRPALTGAAERGRQVFAAMGCGSCHRLAAAGSSGELGPPLDERLPAHTRASLRAVIVSPPTSVMPDNFGDRLGERELDALVSFLIAARER